MEDHEKSGENEAQDVTNLSSAQSSTLAWLPEQREIITASSGNYEAKVDVGGAFDETGRNFKCTLYAYTATANNRYKGNLYISSNSNNSWVFTKDNCSQDGGWHQVNRSGEISSSNGKGRILFRYTYDRNDTWDPVFEMIFTFIFRPRTPTIDPIKSFTTSTFDVVGGGAVAGAFLALDSGAGTIGTGTGQPSGRWSVEVTVADGINSQRMQAYQQVIGFNSSRTPLIYMYRAKLTYPTPGAVVPMKDLVYQAIGAPGSAMYALKSTNIYEPWSDRHLVNQSGTWQGASIKDLSSGDAEVKVRFYDNPDANVYGYTQTVAFKVLGYPNITAPNDNTEQEQTFTVSGSNRMANASVQVFIDTTSTSVGTAPASTSATWSAPVTLQPGARRVAAEQFFSGKQSGRGSSVLYRIRPAKPTLLSRPKGDGIEFYGKGYPTGRMHIHVSGDDINSIDVDIPASGDFTKDLPADVVPGTYRYSGRQSVSDGGTGRIYSSGWVPEISVSKPTPVPTSVTATPDGQRPTFFGRGNRWGASPVKVGIFNNGVMMRSVPQGEVQTDLSWSTTATEDLAPGVYTNLTARQWVNNQWSADSATILLTIASPPPNIINPPVGVPTGQRPRISGTAWPRSTITVTVPAIGEFTVTATDAGEFVFDPLEDWPPGTYTITVTATFGGSPNSSPSTRTITVKPPVPGIDTPENAEVGLSPLLEGEAWWNCWVFLFAADNNLELGSGLVGPNGKWAVQLSERPPGELSFYARQKESQTSNNISDPTANRTVTVGVPRGMITVPTENGNAARKSMFSGTTTARSGSVELFHPGQSAPFLEDILINPADGTWQALVTLLEVGPRTLEIKVRQGSYLSTANTRRFTVVPNAPVVDSPPIRAKLGALLKISGYAHEKDEVRIDRRGNFLQLGTVRVTPQGTWSTGNLRHNMVEGDAITAVATCEGYSSVYSAHHVYSLLTPAIDIIQPQPGDYTGARPHYVGMATPNAMIRVADWFNGDELVAPTTQADDDGRWSVIGDKDLPVGPARVMVCQTVDGVDSEWVQSGRFMVERLAADVDAPSVDRPLEG